MEEVDMIDKGDSVIILTEDEKRIFIKEHKGKYYTMSAYEKQQYDAYVKEGFKKKWPEAIEALSVM